MIRLRKVQQESSGDGGGAFWLIALFVVGLSLVFMLCV